MKSKFLNLYNILMEENEIDQLSAFDLKDKLINLVKELPNINRGKKPNNFYNLGREQLANDNRKIQDYEVIISGASTFKLVKKNHIKDSGEYKWDKIKDYDKIKKQIIEKNPHFNAIFFVLRSNYEKDPNNFDIRVPSNAGNKQQQQEAQIQDFQNQIDCTKNGQIYVTTPPNDKSTKKGPFNKITKATGGRPRPKADAVLINTDDENIQKMYLSLKNGGRPASFKQYGGKQDISKLGNKQIDDDILNKNKFIKQCYDKIINLFDTIKEKYNSDLHYNMLELKTYLSNQQPKFNANITFQIPEEQLLNSDDLLKTKFGQDFSFKENKNKKSSLENVDVLIDGKIQINNNSKIEGEYHTQWNPAIYDVKPKIDKDQLLQLYQMVIVFAPCQRFSKFGKIKHCRFNTFPYNKYKNYLESTKKIFQTFL